MRSQNDQVIKAQLERMMRLKPSVRRVCRPLQIAVVSSDFALPGTRLLSPHPGDVRIAVLAQSPDDGPIRPVVPQGKSVHLPEHPLECQVLESNLQ
jgi:hypothetical protein